MTRFVRKSGFEAVELDGEWLVLNSQDYTVTTLNEVGGYCWELLSEKRTVGEITQAIKSQYILEEALIQQDIKSFLSGLVECGLVEHAS